MTLAERIVEYRARERLNQTEFANKVGVTTMTISNIENGRQDPSRLTIAKIEQVIGKEVAQ